MANKDKERKELLDDLVITGGGNVVGGDTIRISGEVVNLSIHNNVLPDLEQLRLDYLSHIKFSYQSVSFKGIPSISSVYRQISLESIYVPLFARAELQDDREWTKTHQSTSAQQVQVISIEKVLGKHSKTLILGDPGSGKSTLLKYFALQLASQTSGALPILVPLSAYAEALSRTDLNLQQFLSEYFSGRTQGLANLEPLFTSAFTSGQAIVMLDGLDECKSQIRAHLISKIEAFASETARKGNKVIVTSRIVGYREASLDSQYWSLYTLLDFNQEGIKEFASKWFMAFELATQGDTIQAKQSAEHYSQTLVHAINTRPGLVSLASNPLMLTFLGLSMRYEASLPLQRAELYEQYLKILISTWNLARSLDYRPVGQSLDYFQVVRVLGKLAFWLKNENPVAGVISEEQLIEWLTQYYSGSEWEKPRGEAMIAATEFLESVRKDSNILVERGQGYFGFVHLAIEEHLAARGLTQLPTEKSIEFIETHLDDPSWQEVFILAIGLLGIRGQRDIAGELTQKILNSGKTGVNLAGKILDEVGEQVLGKKVSLEIREAVKKNVG